MILLWSAIAIVLAWWSLWTAYVEHMRRAGLWSRFRPATYDALTGIAAVCLVALWAVEGVRLWEPAPGASPLAGAILAAAVATGFWGAQQSRWLRRRTRRSRAAPLAGARMWLLPVTGAAEEALFRGGIQTGLLLADVPPTLSVVSGSALFGLAHYFRAGWSGVVLQSIFGLGLGVIALCFGLPLAALAHAIYNSIIAVTWRRSSGPSESPSRSGAAQ